MMIYRWKLVQYSKYNKFNYQSRYNSEYKDEYKKNYNIISNSRLPPINYGQYYI